MQKSTMKYVSELGVAARIANLDPENQAKADRVVEARQNVTASRLEAEIRSSFTKPGGLRGDQRERLAALLLGAER